MRADKRRGCICKNVNATSASAENIPGGSAETVNFERDASQIAIPARGYSVEGKKKKRAPEVIPPEGYPRPRSRAIARKATRIFMRSPQGQSQLSIIQISPRALCYTHQRARRYIHSGERGWWLLRVGNCCFSIFTTLGYLVNSVHRVLPR